MESCADGGINELDFSTSQRSVDGIVTLSADADNKSRDGNNGACPYCGQPMKRGYFLIGGVVMFAESTMAFGPVFATKPDIDLMLEGEQIHPPHVIVGGSGYHADPKNWPKTGMFCQDCLAIVVKLRNC
jgi:hypothetical protein